MVAVTPVKLFLSLIGKSDISVGKIGVSHILLSRACVFDSFFYLLIICHYCLQCFKILVHRCF